MESTGIGEGINAIAGQTNLLAVNATVEAPIRAGFSRRSMANTGLPTRDLDFAYGLAAGIRAS